MKIVVCIKVIKGEINPFDECALEAALSIKDADITVVTMGPANAKEPLMRISRHNVGRVILLTDSSLAGSDTLATSYALSCIIKDINPELIICGRQSIDGDTAQVGPCLAAILGYNLITNVMRINNTDFKIECDTRCGKQQASYPALITTERINTLRFPKMGAKIKDVKIVTPKDYNIDMSKCGLNGSPTKVLKSFESRRGTRKCKFISIDELDYVIKKSLETSESKKNTIHPDRDNSENKLKDITVIHQKDSINDDIRKELLKIADTLSFNIKEVTGDTYMDIAEKIKNHRVVLWPADLWGRKTAPQVAAYLKTGLCADCTALETDGENLFMYRPAFGGTLTAKIMCKTTPQMATVRTEGAKSGDLIFGMGRGAANDLDFYMKLAEKYHGETTASRAAVDMGLFPYEKQVGLTGKNISPKVYVACGISGAVQHTCAIENADTIIAINKDKDARIFEYADYGIII